MKSLPILRRVRERAIKQRGMVLFFALIALVVMSLAAVALIRSVDTSTIIAGNLAFRQAATSSGDAGINAALIWLEAEQTAMDAAGNDVYMDPGCPACVHAFNITNAPDGYYSSVHDDPLDPDYLNLFADSTWNIITAIPELSDDDSGNKIRYVIQRMCRAPNQSPTTGNCLFSSSLVDKNEKGVKAIGTICKGTGCTPAGQSPQIRITARVTGPRNTVSYVQSFVY